jgi:hypothetical protein
MASLGYIEVLDAKSRVAQRFAVEALPITIGRAYSNGIILDDPYVSPTHLRIGLDDSGRLHAEDLESVNGLRAPPGGKRVASLPLESGKPFQIGHTTLRYCELGEPVAPAAVDLGERAPPWPPRVIGPASLLVLLVALLLEYYFESYERFNLARSFSESLTTLSIVFTWAGLWSLLSRIVVSRFYYAEHFALACAAIMVSLALNITAEWTEFLLPLVPGVWAASVFGSGALIAALVFGHLSLASPLLRRSRLWAGLGVSVVVIGAGVLADYAGRDAFSTTMEYSGIVKAVDARFVPTVSTDQFLTHAAKTRRELEALAQKAKPGTP